MDVCHHRVNDCQICKVLKKYPGYHCDQREPAGGQQIFEIFCQKHHSRYTTIVKKKATCPGCFIEKAFLNQGLKIDVTSVYRGRHTKVKCFCHGCKRDFYTNMDCVIRNSRQDNLSCDEKHLQRGKWGTVFRTLDLLKFCFECDFDDDDNKAIYNRGFLFFILKCFK